MIIEITTPGSSIHRKRERFVIKTPKNKDVEVSADKVEAILVSSNSMISTQVMRLCIERHIQLVLTSYTGKPIARVWSSMPGRQTALRRQQYLNHNNEFAFNFTKQLVFKKLANQKKFLAELKQNRSRGNNAVPLSDTISFIKQISDKLENYRFDKNFAQVFLGFEGTCATRYFAMISTCLPKKWHFRHRSQNPGLDGFNASLNYLYGMAYSSIEKVVILSGLDPHGGFYHKDQYGKPTLVYDLIEPHRPIIDKALMYLFNRRIVKDNWFLNDKVSPAVEITKTGREELVYVYKNKCLTHIEKESWQQCRKLCESLLSLEKLGSV